MKEKQEDWPEGYCETCGDPATTPCDNSVSDCPKKQGDMVDVLAELIGDMEVLFWTCPKKCHGFIDWNFGIATCRDCGETSR